MKEQPALFELPQEKGKRNMTTKRSRKRNDLTAHLSFLRAYRIAHDNDEQPKLKELQHRFGITHFPLRLLPDDIFTIEFELINEDYAQRFKKILTTYHRENRTKNEQQPAERTLADIFADMLLLMNEIEELIQTTTNNN